MANTRKSMSDRLLKCFISEGCWAPADSTDIRVLRENRKRSRNPIYIKAERGQRLQCIVMRSWTKATSTFVMWCLCFPAYFFPVQFSNYELARMPRLVPSVLQKMFNVQLTTGGHDLGFMSQLKDSIHSITALNWIDWILTNSERRVPSTPVKKYYSIWPWHWSMIVLHLFVGGGSGCRVKLTAELFYRGTETAGPYGISLASAIQGITR